jgi:hypothetical protein
MRPVILDGFEMAVVLSKLVFIYQANLFQECQGAIDSRQTDPCVAFPDALENGFSVQVFLALLQNLQYELPSTGKSSSPAANSVNQVALACHCGCLSFTND